MALKCLNLNIGENMEVFLGPRKLFISSLKDIETYMKADLTSYSNGEVCLDLDIKEYTDEICENLAYLLEKCYVEAGGANVTISLTNSKNSFMFSEKEWENIFKLETVVDEFGILCFYDEFDFYETDKVLSAYHNVKTTVDFIKSKTDSPLERFLMAYDYVATFMYKGNDNDVGKSRSLVQILNGFDIVCVGYAELLSCICKELGIRCISQDCIVGDGVTIPNHRNNLVFIDDDKYNIHGAFHCDVCWDSLREGKEPLMEYNYCLLPAEDLQKHIDKVSIWSPSKYLYDNFNKEEMYPLILSINDFLNPVDCLGFERKHNKETKVDENFKTNIEQAAETLLKIMKKHHVKPDAYASMNYINAKYIPLIELVLLLDSKDNEKLVEKYVEQFSTSNKKLSVEPKEASMIFGSMVSDDIYKYLNEIKNHENSWLTDEYIQKYLQNYREVENFSIKLCELKRKSKPISLKIFRKALVEVRKIIGFDEKGAILKANQAIEKTSKYSEKIFKEGAKNCFSVCAREKRLKNQKGDN